MPEYRRNHKKSDRQTDHQTAIIVGLVALAAGAIVILFLLFKPTPIIPVFTTPIIPVTGATDTPEPTPTYQPGTPSPTATHPAASYTLGAMNTVSSANAHELSFSDSCDDLFAEGNFEYFEDVGIIKANIHGYADLFFYDYKIYIIVEDVKGRFWVSGSGRLQSRDWSAPVYLRVGEPFTILAVAGDEGLFDLGENNAILDPEKLDQIPYEMTADGITCIAPSLRELPTKDPNATRIPANTDISEENPVGQARVTYPEYMTARSSSRVLLEIHVPIPVEFMPLLPDQAQAEQLTAVDTPLNPGSVKMPGTKKSIDSTIQVSNYMWAKFTSINIAGDQEKIFEVVDLNHSRITTWFWDITAPDFVGLQNFSITVGKKGSEKPVWTGDFELEIVPPPPTETATSTATMTATSPPTATMTATPTPTSTPSRTSTPALWVVVYRNGCNFIIVIFFLGLVIVAIFSRKIIRWIKRQPPEQPSNSPPKGGQDDESKIDTVRIFISYRRSDSADIAGRIYDRLVERFGKEPVFKDVDSIPYGVDFKEKLDEKVEECDVLLAIIGDHWLDASDSTGRKRLENPDDFVRIEIESALAKGIRVIPLLVRGAQMPAEASLPASLRKLAYKNGIPVRPDPDFHRDMDRLIEALDEYVRQDGVVGEKEDALPPDRGDG